MPIDVDNDNNDSQSEAENREPESTVTERRQDNSFTFHVNQHRESEENKRNDNHYRINTRSNVFSSEQAEGPEHIRDIKNLQTPELIENVKRVEEGRVDEYLQEQAKSNMDNIRTDTIYKEALKYGTQSALYYRSTQINNFLEEISNELDQAYAFQPLLMANGRVVPPVILEGERSYFQDGDQRYSEVNKTFQIHKQARLINTPLNWRSYVNFSPTKPALPNSMSLPLNEKEDEVWEEGVVKGWSLGMRQANNIFDQQFTELEIDYIGMVRYHMLETASIVSDPVTHSINLGVNKNEDTLNIGETSFEITRLPDFQTDSQAWEALPKMRNFIDINDI